jgi:hypothetical protein
MNRGTMARMVERGVEQRLARGVPGEAVAAHLDDLASRLHFRAGKQHALRLDTLNGTGYHPTAAGLYGKMNAVIDTARGLVAPNGKIRVDPAKFHTIPIDVAGTQMHQYIPR